jgi:hypothetical protein
MNVAPVGVGGLFFAATVSMVIPRHAVNEWLHEHGRALCKAASPLQALLKSGRMSFWFMASFYL